MSFEPEPNFHSSTSLHSTHTSLGWHPFGAATYPSPSAALGLGPEFLMSDSGALSPISSSSSHKPNSPSATSLAGTTPAPTLVGAAGGLQFDLIWDPSVASAPSGFIQAVKSAAQYLSSLFSTKEVVNVDVGYGEVDGSPLGAGALGESESYGYLTNYSTVTGALRADGYGFSASNEPKNGQFFLTSAETKAFGLVNPTSTTLDGYVGFSSTYPMYDGTSGSVPSNQYDLFSIAEHEITEVMGRIGIEGASMYGMATYTPLDLFNFNKPGTLELSSKGGYFSTNDGSSNLGAYNNAAVNGGDITDWASSVANNSFDAFTSPGVAGAVTSNDILEVAALGYKLSAAGVAAA